MVAIKTEGRRVSLERCHRQHPWMFFISFIICAGGNVCIGVCRCTVDLSDLIVMETGNCQLGITTPLFLELYHSRVVHCIMHVVSPPYLCPHRQRSKWLLRVPPRSRFAPTGTRQRSCSIFYPSSPS